jgi:predicted transcriptional regulator of viral defense system
MTGRAIGLIGGAARCGLLGGIRASSCLSEENHHPTRGDSRRPQRESSLHLLRPPRRRLHQIVTERLRSLSVRASLQTRSPSGNCTASRHSIEDCSVLCGSTPQESPQSARKGYIPLSAICKSLKGLAPRVQHNIRTRFRRTGKALDPMPAADKGLAKARHVFTKHGGMLRTPTRSASSIHPRTLYVLRDSGEIEQLGRGLHRLSIAPPLSSPDLVPVAIRIPRAVVCLISALAHRGLTQVPHSVDLELPSHAQIPKIDGVPLRVFWYSELSFSAGIETIRMDEAAVRLYSPEKTIDDCFKYRNKSGLDLAIETLRTYRDRTPNPNLHALARSIEPDLRIYCDIAADAIKNALRLQKPLKGLRTGSSRPVLKLYERRPRWLTAARGPGTASARRGLRSRWTN